MLRSIFEFLFGSSYANAFDPNRVRESLRDNPEGTIRWGKICIPMSDAMNHFLAIGTTGSGKTTILRLLMQSVLPRVGTGDCRALVNDAKQDAMPLLAGMVDLDKIVLLNPFDSRGVAWDIAKDLNEPRLILEFCSTIFPAVPDSTQFFRNATVNCSYGIIMSYFLSGLDFTLGDVLRPLQDASLIVQVLCKHPETKHIAKRYFRDEKLISNLLASFAVSSLPYEHVAACWEHAETKVSFKDWAQGELIYVLGNSEVSRAALDNINRCMTKTAASLVLDKPESMTSASWFFFDELSDAGKLDGLIPLAKKGRSKGAKIAIAFQSVSGLRDPNLYGQHGADELLGQFGNRFLGRLECVATADYLSQLIGEQEIVAVSTSYTSGKESSSTTSYSVQTRKAVLAGHLMAIPPCNIENGLTGYCMSPRFGTFRTHLDGEDLFLDALKPHADVPHFLPRPAMQQILRPWNLEQAAKFDVRLNYDLALEKLLDKSVPLRPKTKRLKHVKPKAIEHDPLQGVFE